MPTTVFVYSTDYSDEIHPSDKKLYYPLRGEDRKEAQERLRHMMPRVYEIEAMNAIDENIARAGNMQELRHLAVYQKARSEDKFKYDLTLKSLDLQDVIQLWVEENATSDPYLRHVELPLNVTMFSKTKLHAAGPGNIGRLDATRNCCGEPSLLNCKRILYYALVVYVFGIILPILEFRTSEHSVMDVSICLKRFRYFAEGIIKK